MEATHPSGLRQANAFLKRIGGTRKLYRNKDGGSYYYWLNLDGSLCVDVRPDGKPIESLYAYRIADFTFAQIRSEYETQFGSIPMKLSGKMTGWIGPHPDDGNPDSGHAK